MPRRPDIAPLVDFMRGKAPNRAPQAVVGKALAPRLPDATPLATLGIAQRASALASRGAGGVAAQAPQDRPVPRFKDPNNVINDLADALGINPPVT